MHRRVTLVVPGNRWVLFLFLSAALALGCTSPYVPTVVYDENETVEKLSESDLADIQALTDELGIGRVESISIEEPLLPYPCTAAVVRTFGEEVAPHRRRMPVAYLVRSGWRDCFPGPEPEGADVARGDWRTRRDSVWIRDTWRVEDGDWHVDVEFEEGIGYELAARAFLATRRGELVLPDGAVGRALSADLANIDAGDIRYVMRWSESPDSPRTADGSVAPPDDPREDRFLLLHLVPDSYVTYHLLLELTGDSVLLRDIRRGIH